MSNELGINYTGDKPVYVVLKKYDDLSKVLTGPAFSSFVTYVAGDLVDYDIPLADLGGNDYSVDMPSAAPPGDYLAKYYAQLSSTPGVVDEDNDLFLDSETFNWGGEDISPISEPAEDGNYVTVDEVKHYKVNGIEVLSGLGYSDEEISVAIKLAEAMVESLTNNFFYEKTLSIDFDIDDVLFLPYPLLEVTSVTEVDNLGVVKYTYPANSLSKSPLYLRLNSGSVCCGRLGVNDLFGPAGRNCGGGGYAYNKIRINGVWGRTDVPLEIKEAVMLLILEKLSPGSTGMVANSISQAVWSDFTITFKGEKTLNTSGFIKIDNLLAGFVNYADMFRVV